MPEWIPWEKEMCRTCWASCCHDMLVEASIPDLIRLGLLTEEEASAPTSLARAARRLKNAGIVKDYRRTSMIFILEQKPNKDCVFLDDSRRCTVYKKRPTICREFPKIGPKPGSCPYVPK